MALIDKGDKMLAAKTPKGLIKKKEKAGVGVRWAREPRASLGGACGAGGKEASKSRPQAQGPDTGLLPAAPHPLGREDFHLSASILHRKW